MGPDGDWVANSFFTTDPTFDVYVPGVIEGHDWPLGNTITVNINDGEYIAQANSEQRPGVSPGETRVLFDLREENFSIEAGDHIVMTDGSIFTSRASQPAGTPTKTGRWTRATCSRRRNTLKRRIGTDCTSRGGKWNAYRESSRTHHSRELSPSSRSSSCAGWSRPSNHPAC